MGPLAISTLCLGAAALIAVGLLAVAHRAFMGHIEELTQALERTRPASEARTDLPAEVFALALRLGATASAGSRLVRLTQRGEMTLQPGSTPLSFTARQVIGVAEPGFLWHARFRLAGVPLRIVDYLVDGEAGLQGRLADAYPVVDMAGGDDLFRGEAMRYLGELFWNPDAVLCNRALRWRVIDPRTLAVATGDGARTCEVLLRLDDHGDPVSVNAPDRPRQVGHRVEPCPWFARVEDYRTIGGRRIPTRAQVGWMVDGAAFVYWRGTIETWSLEH